MRGWAFSERNEMVSGDRHGPDRDGAQDRDRECGALALADAAAAAEEATPEVFHIVMAGMAQAMPLAMLGGREALRVSEALGAFVRGAPNLTITLTSTDPKGIGLAELMAAEDNPALLRDKVTVTAEASGEPVPFVWPEIAPAPEPQITMEPAPEAAPADPADAAPDAPSPRAEEKSNVKN